MSRNKNGWIMLHSLILEKKFTPVQFKVFVGLLLLADHKNSKNSGIVDLPLRDISSRLDVSIGALVDARNKLVTAGRIELLRIPGNTKPTTGIRIVNYDFYQQKKIVSPNEHSSGEIVSPNEHSTGEIVSPNEQIVSPNEHSVSPNEQSRIQNDPLRKANKTNKELIDINNKQTNPKTGSKDHMIARTGEDIARIKAIRKELNAGLGFRKEKEVK